MASSVFGRKVSFSTESLSTNDPVVSVDWLYANLKKSDMKVLDASWYMPDEQRNPIQEYQVAHILGALFFDVDGISDRNINFGDGSGNSLEAVLWKIETMHSRVHKLKNQLDIIMTKDAIKFSSSKNLSLLAALDGRLAWLQVLHF